MTALSPQHICTPIKSRGATCQHLHGFSSLIASLSFLFATATKKAASLQIIIVSREFRDAFEKFDKWCRRFFDELQTAMDAHRGFVTLTPDDAAKVMHSIQELLWVVSALPSAPSACSDR